MNLSQEAYKIYAKKKVPKSKAFQNCLLAFLVGGGICTLGQGLFCLYSCFGVTETTVKILVPTTLIAFTALFTGIGWFDKLAKHAGAGTLVPITGFANAVVSPALDNRAEGYIAGVGAKMFIIAGPVIVYGTVASVVWGIVYWMVRLI